MKQIFMILLASVCAGHGLGMSTPAAGVLPPSFRPEFSWDTVPIFYHAGKWAGRYTDEEVKFIAEKFPLVVIEKMHGQGDPEFAGRVDKAVFLDAARLKAANSAVKVLFYFNPFVDYRYYSWKNKLPEIPAWALRDPQGNPIYKDRGHVKFLQFDISRQDFMDWWIQQVSLVADQPQIDGIFIDALSQIVRQPTIKYKTWGREKYLSMRWHCHVLLAESRKALNGKILINNGLFAAVDGLYDGGISWLENADGVMVEHFGASNSRDSEGNLYADRMVQEFKLIDKAAEMNSVTMVKAWPGDMYFLNPKYSKYTREERMEVARKNLEFAMAAFLISARENCYFGYSWGWEHEEGWMQWFSEFDRPLGQPKGEARRDAWKFFREFEHARVQLDLEHETAKIEWLK